MTGVAERSAVILMAEDDPGDIILARKALENSHLLNELHVVNDGQELLDCLRGDGDYEDDGRQLRPDMILLDLNMPGMDGREALAEIKKDAKLRDIPVVILTTSNADEDIRTSYDLGANSYIKKPATLDGLVQAVQGLEHYWFHI